MEKLFAAVRKMYPEAEVLDVRFQASSHGSFVPDIETIDQGFAEVILRDCSVDINELDLETVCAAA